MYTLQNPANKIYKMRGTGPYITQHLSLAIKFNTRAEAEFILQDLQSRDPGLNYQVVEVT